MKRFLLLVPLLITSCSKGKVIYNVSYYFDTTKMQYIVIKYDKDFINELARYSTTAEKVYTIYVSGYVYKDNELINNEFYLSTKKLFVYYRRWNIFL